MSAKDIAYLVKSLQKIEKGQVSSEHGSHLIGIFAKSANIFEKRMKRYLADLLKHASVNYDQEIRSKIKGGPSFIKVTLGQMIATIKETQELKPDIIPKLIPGQFSSFMKDLKRINKTWIQIKHGEEVQGAVLILQIKSMLRLLQQIEGQNLKKQ